MDFTVQADSVCGLQVFAALSWNFNVVSAMYHFFLSPTLGKSYDHIPKSPPLGTLQITN